MSVPRLPHDVRSSSLVILASHALRLALGFVVTLLLARSLPPDDYGVFSVLMGFLLTAAAFSDLGINIPFVRFYVEQGRSGDVGSERFANFAFTSRILLSAGATAVALAVLSLWGPELLQKDIPGWAVLLGSILVFTEGISSFLLSVLQAQEKFKILAACTVGPNAIRALVLLVLVALDAVSLLSAFILFSVSLMITTGLTKLILPTLSIEWKAWESARQFRPAVSWTRWTAVQTISNVVVSKFDILALGVFAVAPSRIGNYALGLAFASLLNVLQTSTMTLLLPKVSALATRADLYAYRRRLWNVELVLLVGVAAASVAAYGLLNGLYADRYPSAAGLMLILAAGFSFSVLITPWTLLSYTVNQPQIPAVQNIVGIVVLAASSLLLVPRWEIYGMALSVLSARASSELTGLWLTRRALRRHAFVTAAPVSGGSA
jgi:O-antigen/teichoic acid export membrane protein